MLRITTPNLLSGMTIASPISHPIQPGTMLLNSGVTLDVYVCNFSGDNSDRAHALFADVIAAFAPQRLETKEVARGCLQVPRLA